MRACNECDKGKYMDMSGGVNPTCYDCEPGFFQHKMGQMTCMPCMPGRYADGAGLDACEDCSEGKFGSGEESSDVAFCPSGLDAPQKGRPYCKKMRCWICCESQERR